MKPRKILLAVKSKKMENLGVMYLSAVVKKAGHECKIVGFDEVVAANKLWEPDTIGFSCMTGDQETIKKFSDIIPYEMPVGKIVDILVGGPHPTFFPEDFDDTDLFIVRGEAEGWMADYLGDPTPYLNINSIPWPDRTDFPGWDIRDFITTRGCPYNCGYCYNKRWAELFPHVPRVRTRSPEDVVAEVEHVNPLYAYFQDSCFALNMNWLREFGPLYKKRVGAPYQCHLRPEQLSEERIGLLADSYCYAIRVALESASDRLRDLVGRGGQKLGEIERGIGLLKKNQIVVTLQNILGLPTSTIEEDLATLEFNMKVKPDYSWVSIFNPYPGTELGDLCKREGYYEGDYTDLLDNFFDRSPLNFSDDHKEQLECLQKMFATCVRTGVMPKVEDLEHGKFEEFIHRAEKRLGDWKQFKGLM